MQRARSHELYGTTLVIRPNRSLPVAGMALLFAALSLWAAAIGIGFALLGIWMILPFAGLQIIAIGLLCWWLYQHVDDCELVTLEADRVHVMRRQGRKVTRHEFSRHWLNVRFDGSPRRLSLGSHGNFVNLADDIDDTDRALLAHDLRNFLRSPA